MTRKRPRRLRFERLEDRWMLAGTGLTGQYFDNADFSGLKLTRVDSQVDFDWGSAAPHSSVEADMFSIRWTGRIQPEFSEVYTFYVTSDDGVRLWIDGQLIVSQWTNHAADTVAGQIALAAGGFFDIRLEYYEQTGAASVRLEWSSPRQTRQVIPAAQLWPDSGPDDRGTILLETWADVAGDSLTALTGRADYPDQPSARDYLLAFESLQTDWGDSYGQRVHGYLVPPLTGDYVLAVSGDDRVELYLSSDADPGHKILVATVPSSTAVRDFSAFPSQQSAPVSLVAGQRYYVEALHKEDTAADHFSVAWQVPGSSQFVVIPGDALEPFGADTVLPAEGSILATLTSSHPRLLVTPQRWQWLAQQIAGGGQMQAWYNSILSSANSILTQTLPQYNPDNRDTILGISRSVVDHIYKLAMVYRMTGDARYAERAWDELNAAAGFPDWHPAHFLDTAEMTHAFAIGYDWLYDYWTAGRRTVLVDAMVNKGLIPGLDVLRSNGWWSASSSNNWNLVCNGGLVLGALAIADQQPLLTEELLARAIPSVQAILRHFTADSGGWYEGPGYWGYSTEYNTRMVAGLIAALGTDFGLSRTVSLSDAGLYPLEMLGPSRKVFNFADASAGVTRGPQLLWYARRYNRPEYAWYERTYGSASVLGLLWYDSRGSEPASLVMPTDDHFRGDVSAYATQDVVTMRGSWADPQTTFVGFKAGRVGDSHGHLDAGSFVLDALGQRWIHDLGGDDYALPGYFGSQRWDYYRMRAEGHNTLVINPTASRDQILNALPPVLRQESNADGSLAVADLTSAYSGVTRVWRGLQLSRADGSLLVQDEIEASTPAEVWSFFHVSLDPSQIQIAADGGSALLTTATGRMWVQILGSPGARFELRDPV
ncbi:MAG: PA14 domain-containing protein, partial [Planctomycetes bacterium]|nr:PA14 domain-containing protein [Planctomycetota bacterium]